MTFPYMTPAAFRRALTERLRAAAKPNGPWPLAERGDLEEARAWTARAQAATEASAPDTHFSA